MTPRSDQGGTEATAAHTAWRQRTVIEHRSRMTPELLGDARDLAAIICLDLEGLRFLVGELSVHNHRDTFVWELSEALTRAEAMLDAA